MKKQYEELRKQLKEKAERVSLNQIRVNDSQTLEDYMEYIPSFKVFNLDDKVFKVESFSKIPVDLESWAFDLLIKNMNTVYQNSWKWDFDTKRAELTNRDARFLVAFSDDEPVGFVHFRFEQLDGDFVIYIYDAQVDKTLEKTKLRETLIEAIEQLGISNHVISAVTFAFKADTEYNELLHKMNYQFHHLSPSVFRPNQPEKYKHEIYFKALEEKEE